MSTNDINWRLRGLCSFDGEFDPDMWFAADLSTRRFAQHLCLRHCPVLDECREEMSRFSHRGTVVGGTIWSDKEGVPVHDSNLPVPCSLCRENDSPAPAPPETMAFSAWR